MRFDPIDSMEGRHLIYAYAAVILLQGGYFAHLTVQWLKLDRLEKKATKSL